MKTVWMNKKKDVTDYLMYTWVIAISATALVLALQVHALTDRIERVQERVIDTQKQCDDVLNCTLPASVKE